MDAWSPITCGRRISDATNISCTSTGHARGMELGDDNEGQPRRGPSSNSLSTESELNNNNTEPRCACAMLPTRTNDTDLVKVKLVA